MSHNNREWLEIEALFNIIYQRYGYDFRQYSRDSACRRVRQRLELEGLESVSELQTLILHDEAALDALLRALSINVTEMFRDPLFYQALRDQALPLLAGHQHLKIWHAGCATGEEAYSMAILLSEENIYDRSLIYATDFNNAVLEKAKSGIFPLDKMRINTSNYRAAGGKRSFADYYHSNYDSARMSSALRRNTVFAHHNLATDNSFGEMQMVICRNVLIYFNRELQERVIKVFADSLCPGGILCLGSHETLRLNDDAGNFEPVAKEQRIYQKVE